jgi:MFS family permease
MFGLLLSGSGLGSVIGAVIFSMMEITNKKGLILVLSAFGMFVFQFIYSFVGNPYLLLFVCMLSGFGWAGFMIFNTGLLMAKTQEGFRGRVQGLQTLLIGLFPLGAISFGFIGDYIGPLNALRLASTLGCIGLLVIIFMGPKIILEE